MFHTLVIPAGRRNGVEQYDTSSNPESMLARLGVSPKLGRWERLPKVTASLLSSLDELRVGRTAPSKDGTLREQLNKVEAKNMSQPRQSSGQVGAGGSGDAENSSESKYSCAELGVEINSVGPPSTFAPPRAFGAKDGTAQGISYIPRRELEQRVGPVKVRSNICHGKPLTDERGARDIVE